MQIVETFPLTLDEIIQFFSHIQGICLRWWEDWLSCNVYVSLLFSSFCSTCEKMETIAYWMWINHSQALLLPSKRICIKITAGSFPMSRDLWVSLSWGELVDDVTSSEHSSKLQFDPRDPFAVVDLPYDLMKISIYSLISHTESIRTVVVPFCLV